MEITECMWLAHYGQAPDEELLHIQKATEEELSKITLEEVKNDVSLWIAKEQ